ncbi:hypothetical protein [Streptomyces rochei]|uniref:hypothetical protein n=1 Tax=Streptomyces rochei TaxID=1928 RepID=UPI0037B0429A
MWEVVAVGAVSGAVYTYEVDAPEYAPEGAVWDAACRAHDLAKRARKTSEFLSIRPGEHTVFWREKPKARSGALKHL